MKSVVVIPTYNEIENLETLVERIRAHVSDICILIVDDNSPDGTGDLADKMAAASPDTFAVLHRPGKRGLGAAYVAGYRHAMDQWPAAEAFFQMDADLSHDPAYLPEMIAALEEADLVIGSRYVYGVSVANWPLRRLLLSKMGTLYTRLLTGMPLTDCTGGFKGYRRETLAELDLSGIESNGYCFQIETNFRVWRLGKRLKEVPIIFYERERGQSKIDFGITVEALARVAKLGMLRLLGRA